MTTAQINHGDRSQQDINRVTREIANQHIHTTSKNTVNHAVFVGGIKDGVSRKDAISEHPDYKAGYELGRKN